MSTRGRALFGTAGAAFFLAWCAGQLWLTHRFAVAQYRHSVEAGRSFVARFPDAHVFLLPPTTARDWVPAAAASIVAATALAIIAGLLVRGGRRWSALLVVTVPASNVLWGWQDGRLLGTGWTQLSDSRLTTWTVAGTLIDSVMLLAVVAALVAVVPARTATPVRPALLRTVPVLVVLAGWWAMRHPLPDQTDWIWLVQAAGYVLVVALLVTCALPTWQRAVGVAAVLPFCSLATAMAAIGGPDLAGLGAPSKFLQHALFAAATALYVLGAPTLTRAVRHRRRLVSGRRLLRDQPVVHPLA